MFVYGLDEDPKFDLKDRYVCTLKNIWNMYGIG